MCFYVFQHITNNNYILNMLEDIFDMLRKREREREEKDRGR